LWGEDVNKYALKWKEKEYIDYCKGLANPRQPKFFTGERLLVREITNPSVFCALPCNEYYHDPAIIVILEGAEISSKILCGILNSKLMSFYHFNSSPKATKGAFPKILVEDIKNFPLPKVSKTQQKPFITLVDQILSAKATNPKADTSELEKQIDEMVYKLYELTDDEIAIIEGGSHGK